MPDLKLTIISPLETVMDNVPVEYFRVVLANGTPLSVYPNHAPLIARIGHTKARYRQGQNEKQLEFTGGVIQITQNRIICAIEKNSPPEEVQHV